MFRRRGAAASPISADSLLNLGTGPVTVSAPTTVTVHNSSGTLEIDGNITSGTSDTFNSAGAGTVVLTGSDTISIPGGQRGSFRQHDA